MLFEALLGYLCDVPWIKTSSPGCDVTVGLEGPGVLL